MLSVHEKRVLKKMIYSKITLIVLAVLVVLLARGTWNITQKASHAKINKEKSQRELSDLQKRKQFLEDELQAIQTERGQEAQMRSQFDVGIAGEKMIVLVDTEEFIEEQIIEEKSLFEKMKSWIW